MNKSRRICIITGAGSGIGLATAIEMAKREFELICVGRNIDKLNVAKDEIKKHGIDADIFALDVSNREMVFQMVDDVIKKFGQVDVLINNAGHSSNHRRLLSTPESEIESVVGTNILGTIYCTQAVVEQMSKVDSGTIINVSSIAGLSPSIQGGMIYGATKSAIINFTEFINAEYKFNRIRATAIIPGEVRTPALDRRPVPPSEEDRANMVDPADVAKIIANVAEMPTNVSVPQLVVRPNVSRDSSVEEQSFK